MSSFLEEQAKKRGMTVSEMMRERSLKAKKYFSTNGADAAKKRWSKARKEKEEGGEV